MQSQEIPWQHAVYCRPTDRDHYVFSHIANDGFMKQLPASLRVPDLLQCSKLYETNLQAMSSAVVLKLVTGQWAENVSISSFDRRKRDWVPYDHLERLSLRLDKGQGGGDLDVKFTSLTCHSTLTTYHMGEDHAWRLDTTVPFMADIVILPKVLTVTKVRPIISAFQRLIKKGLKNSLILAGTRRYSEHSFKLIERQQECEENTSELTDHPQAPGPA